MNNSKRLFKIEAFAFFTLMSLFFHINSVKADEAFTKCIVDSYNVAHNTNLTTLTDEQYASFETLDCSKAGINNITIDELSKLSAIQTLYLNNNNLTTLDLSKNTELVNLYVQGNKLTTLNLSKNEELKALYLGFDESVDAVASGCKKTNTYGNNFKELNLSNNKKLEYLYVAKNSELKSLDLSNNTSLKELFVFQNPKLNNLKLGELPNIQKLYLWNNDLSGSFDASNFTSLNQLYLVNNKFDNINVKNLTNLVYLNVSGNNLTTLDLSDNSNLIDLRISNNKIKSLDLTNNENIKIINAQFNNIDTIKFGKPENVEHFVIESNKIHNYDFSKFANLWFLSINDFNDVPIYGDVVNTDYLKDYISSNVKIDKYAVYDELGNSRPYTTDIINGEIGKKKSVNIYTTNFEDGVEYTCNDLELYRNSSANNNLKLLNVNYNKLLNYIDSLDLHFMNVTSDKYIINNETSKIEVGFDDDETIIKNLTLNQDGNLANMKIVGNKLQLIAKDKEFKEFTLIRSIENPKTGYIGAFVLLFVIISIAGVSYIYLKKNKQKLY